MKDITQHIALVKEQLEFHERQSLRFAGESPRAAMHRRTADRFQSLLEGLLELESGQAAIPNWKPAWSEQPKRLALTWEEVDGLPKEVLDELSISDSDRTEFNIIAAIRALGGVASLDRIIVYLFRQNGEVQKRLPLTQRLYRMTQKEMLFSVPGKKGVYSIEPLGDDELSKLN